MYSVVDIYKIDKKIVVTIKPYKSIMYKVIVLIMSAFIIVLPILTSIVLLTKKIRSGFEILAVAIVSVILLIFIYKHLRATFSKEILIIENNKFSYNNSFLGLGKYFDSNCNKIKTFKYVGYAQQTKHPLEIKGDVLGFGTQQGEVEYLNQVGTMILATEFEVLKFGIDVDEEDYLKIKYLLK
jgi:hypothetical protein